MVDIAEINAYCLKVENAFLSFGINEVSSDGLKSNLSGTIRCGLRTLRLSSGFTIIDDWCRHDVFLSTTMEEALTNETVLLNDLLDQLTALKNMTISE